MHGARHGERLGGGKESRNLYKIDLSVRGPWDRAVVAILLVPGQATSILRITGEWCRFRAVITDLQQSLGLFLDCFKTVFRAVSGCLKPVLGWFGLFESYDHSPKPTPCPYYT